MATHIITYDLLSPVQNYHSFLDALKKMGAQRILLSTWLLQTDSEPADILESLSRYMDSNDRLFVAGLQSWAWSPNVLTTPGMA